MSNIADFFPIAGGGKTMKVQDFTTSGTWTKPDGVDAVHILLVGAGGSGGSHVGMTANSRYSGAGGGGRVIKDVLPVTSNLTITIGAGGVINHALSYTAVQADGGDSSIVGTGINKTALGGHGANVSAPTIRTGRTLALRYSNTSSKPSMGAEGAGGFPQRKVDNHNAYIGTNNDYNLSHSSMETGRGIDGYGGGGIQGNYFDHYLCLGEGVHGACNGSESKPYPPNTGGGGMGGSGFGTTRQGTSGSSGFCRIVWFE